MPNDIYAEITSAGEIVVEISGMTYGSVEAQLALVNSDITALETDKADKANTYTKTETDTKVGLLVPKTTTVNAKALSGNITVNASDIPNTPAGGIASTNVQNALNELDTEKANKAQEAWITPTLLNGWKSVVGRDIQYMKDQMGFVHFRGSLDPTTKTSNVFCDVPVGYRPSRLELYNIGTTIASYLAVYDSGSIAAVGVTWTWQSLLPLIYKAV